jgi:1-acyl-sn-glycerol-3-phosphate acyltransferase
MPAARGDLNAVWRFGLPIVAAVARLLFRVRAVGLEHVPDGPAILAANHVSALDGPILAIATGTRRRRMTRYLVAAEFFANPWVGWILKISGQIPLRRGARDAGAIDEAIDTVRGGGLAGIFPEGSVNPDVHLLQRIRKGAARISLGASAPVVPVGIWGTQERWPRAGLRTTRPFRTPIVLAFGEPIEPEGDPDSLESIESFTRRIGAGIEAQALAPPRP